MEKKFESLLKNIATQQKVDVEKVKEEANTYLAEMQVDPHPMVNLLAMESSQFLLSRAYEKTIDVNAAQLKALTKQMRQHSIAFVMTHKTYIDMVVLAVVLARHGLPWPLIFGGANLSFAGFTTFAKKAGIIFIRRGIKDNEVYKSTLKHYISTLVSEKQHFMWAIEGTRSRTGKVVWPKMGILKYIMDGEKQSRNEVKYVPVSIVYDLIPDVDDMVRESRGDNKNPENMKWMINYIRKLNQDYGKISVRFGEPLHIDDDSVAEIPLQAKLGENQKSISKFAFDLVHHINVITPVTTTSLVCTALLSKFALKKNMLEHVVLDLMSWIEAHKQDALVDRGIPINQSVQHAINLLLKSGLIKQIGDGVTASYAIVPEKFLSATYYANMAVHHLYGRAFIELALISIANVKTGRVKAFWREIMHLRDLFKFEFFYSKKIEFTEEIEQDLKALHPDWKKIIKNPDFSIKDFLKEQKILISQVVLSSYIEAYRVVAHALTQLEKGKNYNQEQLLNVCLFVGEEMHWNGHLHRVESVSKPFVQNGIRLAQNKELFPVQDKKKEIKEWQKELVHYAKCIKSLQEIILTEKVEYNKPVPIAKNIVPGSKTESIALEIIEGESGPHIGAFFDLDRTLISDFSAKKFIRTRLMSGKMTPKEIVMQFGGVLVYAMGNNNFAGLAALGAKGVQGISEKVFIKAGEEVYLNHLSKGIYPESRALVAAHMAKGHTVAIVSAATPYQVRPIARELGIKHIMCTEMEVKKGKFTGNIVEPACWGEGKAIAGRRLANELDLDLSKSFFYTDSHEDMQLMDIVGHPRPVNPDNELSQIAYENNWPIFRFNDEKSSKMTNYLRTGLTAGSLIPAALSGVLTGVRNQSWKDGVNSMTSVLGDLGTKLAGINLVVRGKEHLWSHQPAVYIFNHQSNVDMLIMAKLLRGNVVGVAKQELKYTPIGPIMMAAGVIFLDRKNREKAIESLKPAVEALKNGKSLGIAPEGTRSYDYNLGKFKKGAFHIAMQAKVPIVPVIIKNAHDAMPRGTNMVNPSMVEVVVLPPVQTAKWTKAKLDKNIASIRNDYLVELEQSEYRE